MGGNTVGEHVDRRRLETAREALRQAESVTKNAVDSVTINSPTVTINPPVTVIPSPISVTRKRGRPKSDNPMTTAERMRLYRARKKAKAG